MIGRRTAMVVVAASLSLVAAARGEKVAPRRAVFEEIGGWIVLSMDVPGLFPWYDQEGLDAIDSNLDNTLEFRLRVRELASRRIVATRTLVRKLRRDPWKEDYLLRTRVGEGWTRSTFETREEAIARATALVREPIVPSDELKRGAAGPYYYVEIQALRNPFAPQRRRGASATRSSGRDLEWFGRLVEVFAGERAIAEAVVQLRTNPFYLGVKE